MSRGSRIMAVLRVRRLQEQQAQAQAYAADQQAVADAAASMLAEQVLDQDAPVTEASVSDWQGTRAGLLARARQAAALSRVAEQSAARADVTRAQWLEHHERVALLERLAEAQRLSAARSVLAARQSASDDIANARFGREPQS